jgi:ribonucleoside-diphosphate reductase alpha chain
MKDSIIKLLKERYFLDETELTWEELVDRVCHIYKEIKPYMLAMDFLASSPTLMNANTKGKRLGTLSSCFPMGIEDSIEGIYDALKECAITTKYGGGVGYDFSTLRSSKEGIKGLNGRKSSGPIPFIQNFNTALDSIQQGGVRRGAGMGLLDIDHGDIIEFIKAKEDTTKINRLNLSTGMTDFFYEQLHKNPDAIHQIKFKDGTLHDLEYEGKKITTRELWNLIVHHAWMTAEPGIFNKDIAFNQCTTTNVSKTVLANPCSEFTNVPYSSCNLGSINLSNLVEGNKFNWEKFEEIIIHATRFLNNVIDMNKFPIKKIEEVTKKVRPIGLGVMGFAHMLYKKRIPYNSEKAYKLADEIFKYMTLRSMKESVEMAKLKGYYDAFDYELFMKANKRFFTKANHRNIDIEQLQKEIKKYGTRDSAFTSIAPTGTLSFIADTSGGIEPVFALTYSRKIEKLNREYETVFISDPVFEEYLNENYNEDDKIKILKHVAENKGSCQTCELIPEEDRKVFVVAGDIAPMEHVKMLGAVARNTSMSVSKTINLPNTATEEEVSEVYLQAHKEGIIGVTVYRDGCREGILIHSTVDNKPAIVKTNAPKRPRSLPCHVYKISTLNKETKESEKWIVFVGLLEGEPYEIIAGKVDLIDIPSSITEGIVTKVKRGLYQFEYNGEIIVKDITKAFLNDIQEHTTRLMSWGLRHGGGINFLRDVLEKSKGTLVDFNKAIIRAINKYAKDVSLKEKCLVCGSDLIFVEGCIKCKNPECSYGKCG